MPGNDNQAYDDAEAENGRGPDTKEKETLASSLETHSEEEINNGGSPSNPQMKGYTETTQL